MAEGFVNAERLAALLGVRRHTVYRAARLRQLPARRVGGRLMFDPVECRRVFVRDLPALAEARQGAPHE